MRDERNAKYLDAFNAFVKGIVPAGKRKFSTDDENQIFKLLGGLEKAVASKKMVVNFHFWDHGWHHYTRVRIRDQQIVEMRWRNGGTPYLVGRPLGPFEAFHFDEEPDFDFIRFGYKGLPQEGINELTTGDIARLHREEYLELSDGTAIDRSAWDEGIRGYDEYGNPEEVREGDHPVVRELLPGHFFGCSIGSVLNDVSFEDHMRDIANRGEESPAYKSVIQLIKKLKEEGKAKDSNDNAGPKQA
jgi:hypothetical protein